MTRPWTLMEVCGGQTHAILRFGVDELLPPSLDLVHGPGCPVCVTPVGYIDHAVALARREDTIIATFGDMVRVPGSSSSLLHEQASGASVKIVYSALDAVTLAENNPASTVVFLGVGFETTAPTIAGAILTAANKNLHNFFVLCAHKTMPAPMAAAIRCPSASSPGPPGLRRRAGSVRPGLFPGNGRRWTAAASAAARSPTVGAAVRAD